jgi:hypothetical protein
MSIYQLIVLFLSAIVSIAFALISVGWWFRDGEQSTRSLREFNDNNSWGYEWVTTKFGLWLLISAGAGGLCYYALSAIGRWLHWLP